MLMPCFSNGRIDFLKPVAFDKIKLLSRVSKYDEDFATVCLYQRLPTPYTSEVALSEAALTRDQILL
jgi:hypothetical protein